MTLPPRIVELIQRHPLDTPDKTEKVLGGSLENAARCYATRAGYVGRDMALWRVWLAIQEERGVALELGLAELSPQERRWLGATALGAGEPAVGLAAYARYLEEPGAIGPSSNETRLFLDELERAGRGDEAMRWVSVLESRSDTTPVETLWGARWLLRTGQSASADAKVQAVLARHPDWPDGWAVSALIALTLGDPARARAHARKAARRQLYDEQLLAALAQHPETRLSASSAEVAPVLGYEEARAAFFARPGMVLVPSEAAEPHWYGGDDFEMPACKGCGHPIRQWFSLDVVPIEELAQKLPAWPRLPLLSCADCLLWMGRHDYRVEHAQRVVRLLNAAISVTEFGGARRTTPPLARRYAKLTPFVPGESPEDEPSPGALVGGEPLWTQSPERVLCPECDEAMVYVAAMTTPDAFEPPFVINNESGYQYHFACNTCGTLSVIAQFT